MRLALFGLLVGCGRVGFSDVPGGVPAGDAVHTDAVPDVTSGLAYWFPLDETSGARIHALVGMDGIVKSEADVTPVAGRVGGARHFDGVGYMSYVIFPSTDTMCPSVPQLTGSLTLSAWINAEQFHDWNGYTLGNFAIAQGSSGGQGGAWGLGTTNACGAVTAGIEVSFNGTNRAVRCGTHAVAANTWHLITGVYDAATPALDIYLDGVLDDGAMAAGSPPLGSALAAGPMCPYIGATGNQSQLMIGSIDDVRIYTRALSASEVAQLYAHY